MDTGVSNYRFSVEEFNRLDGEIIVMSPIGSQHAGTVMRMISVFQKRLRERILLNPQNPTVLDEFSEPQPDIMLLRPREDFYTTNHPRPNDILLLVEVSDTTLAYDRGRKLRKYAETGVDEVWIVDLPGRIIQQFRHPQGNSYAFSKENRREEAIQIAAFPDISFQVEELIG